LLRIAQGLTQKQLAERAGVNPADVSNAERGLQGIALQRLAAFYGRTPTELLDRTWTMDPPKGSSIPDVATWNERIRVEEEEKSEPSAASPSPTPPAELRANAATGIPDVPTWNDRIRKE
jgi:transcriptional regulator with XRE-family HTH domain